MLMIVHNFVSFVNVQGTDIMLEYEYAVDFGSYAQTYKVVAATKDIARKKLWSEVLTDDQKNNVESIELIDIGGNYP